MFHKEKGFTSINTCKTGTDKFPFLYNLFFFSLWCKSFIDPSICAFLCQVLVNKVTISRFAEHKSVMKPVGMPLPELHLIWNYFKPTPEEKNYKIAESFLTTTCLALVYNTISFPDLKRNITAEMLLLLI